MDVQMAKEIQAYCLEQMKKGGMTPIDRMDCFAEFETTLPSGELVKEFYGVWAADYDTDMAVAEYNNPVDVAVELEKLFPNTIDVKILDVGAGTGVGGKKLAELGFDNVDATDGSPQMLDIAKKLGVYKNVLPAEVLVKGQRMLNVPVESDDVIVSSGSFYPFHLQGHH
jgi:predicted TPR repeat methyltransferase